jgi:hypothetical protein
MLANVCAGLPFPSESPLGLVARRSIEPSSRGRVVKERVTIQETGIIDVIVRHEAVAYCTCHAGRFLNLARHLVRSQAAESHSMGASRRSRSSL